MDAFRSEETLGKWVRYMQCSCGGETLDHDVVQDGVVAAKFAQCKTCGRVRWWFDNRVSAKRESNREKYPEIAEFVDRLRDVFGEAKVLKVVDNASPEVFVK